MSTVKFITFTDVHISSINPQSRLGSYKDDIMAKLNQIKLVGKKLDVDFFICAGDLFNLKAPMRNPHSLNSSLIELFKSFHAPIYMTEGNHDLVKDSYETFDDQPLNVLYKSGALTQLRNQLFVKGDLDVHLRSFPFEEQPNILAIPKADKNADINICVLHLYATPDGGMLFKQKLHSYGEISVLGDDIFVLGHYHIDQGIQKIRRKHFINVGALSRGSLAEDNITRDPKISLVTIEKESQKLNIKAQSVKLKVRPTDEVFDIEQKEEEKKKLKEAEEFVDKLKEETSVVEEGDDRVEKEINKLDLEKEVLAKVSHFLVEADLVLKEITK